MARPRFVLLLLLALTAAASAPARLGETIADLKKRYGTPAPQYEARKDNAAWLFEVEDGQLIYTVTFNAEGRSIAEGLKPLKRAQFNKTIAMDFIDVQVAPLRESKTLRYVKVGESYTFAGQTLSCGEKEYVVVDEGAGMLLVWSKVGVPNIIVVSPEMLRR